MARTRTANAAPALETAAGGHAVPALTLWHEALDRLAGELADVEVAVLPASSRSAIGYPVIAAPATPPLAGADAPVLLPRQGAVVQFRDPRLQDVLLLRPHSRTHASQVDRRLVFALRDHLETLLLAETGA